MVANKPVVSLKQASSTLSRSIKGVPFCVFGCGNSQWRATYQKFPRKIDELLAKRGAARFHAFTVGDANDNMDDVFAQWQPAMWASLHKVVTERTNERTDGRTHGRTDGRMDGRTDGRTDGRMKNERTKERKNEKP